MSTLRRIFSYGPLLIIIAATLWALDGIIRRSLYTLPPISIVFFEHMIGTLCIVPFAFQALARVKWTIKTAILIFLISLGSGIFGTLWFTTALLQVNFISFSVVYLIQKLQPIFAITTARIFLKEQVSTKYIKWAVLALVAAYFVTFKNGVVDLATGAGTVIAALYALGAAAVWGTETTVSKILLKDINPQQSTAARFIVTAILGLIGVFLLGQQASLTAITFSQMSRFFFIAISTGMVAVYIYYKGLQKTDAKISTLLELVYPLLAVVIDAVTYHSFLAPTQYLAAAILLFAIYKISQLQKDVHIEAKEEV